MQTNEPEVEVFAYTCCGCIPYSTNLNQHQLLYTYFWCWSVITVLWTFWLLGLYFGAQMTLKMMVIKRVLLHLGVWNSWLVLAQTAVILDLFATTWLICALPSIPKLKTENFLPSFWLYSSTVLSALASFADLILFFKASFDFGTWAYKGITSKPILLKKIIITIADISLIASVILLILGLFYLGQLIQSFKVFRVLRQLELKKS